MAYLDSSSDEDYDENVAVIIDNGSSTYKAGFSGGVAPRVVSESIIGRPRYPTYQEGTEAKDCYVGYDAHVKRGVLSLTYPMEHGIVTNWDDMEKVYSRTSL